MVTKFRILLATVALAAAGFAPATAAPNPDPIICEILKRMAGTYLYVPSDGGAASVVVINDQGDVYVDGEPYYNCPPYDIIDPSV